MTGSILIVEDDVRLAQLLVQELSGAGYDAAVASNGTAALMQAETTTFDLVVLDLNLPDMDGIDVAKRLEGTAASILMLTARGDVESRVTGLYAGASDYMTKPFSIHELLARVHVRLRERVEPQESISIRGVELDTSAGSCRVAGEAVSLTAHEFRLLELLMTHRGRIFSKLDAEERLYGTELPGSNTIEVFVSNIRRKLAAVGVHDLIETVRGMGYVVR